MASLRTRFTFDGGAASYLGAAIGGFLITVFTLGICYPFALVLVERWRCEHTFVDCQQLIFHGRATELFGAWVKWLLFSIVTLGIYLVWAGPQLQAWKTKNTGFAVPVAPITGDVTAPVLTIAAIPTAAQASLVRRARRTCRSSSVKR